jgi:hypothetical protein
MFKLIFIATILMAFAYGEEELDYCNADGEPLQCGKNPHIGCDSLYDFDPKLCRKWDNIELVEMDDELIDTIVNEHNSARNKTAGGLTINGLTAARMCKMVN